MVVKDKEKVGQNSINRNKMHLNNRKMKNHPPSAEGLTQQKQNEAIVEHLYTQHNILSAPLELLASIVRIIKMIPDTNKILI